MKLSLNWLSDYLTWHENNPQFIADKITTQVAEVDELIFMGQWARQCVVGKVANLRQHPNADKLKMCEVMTKTSTHQVVCGGSNLRDGMRVAFAPVGATVLSPDGPFTLSKATIRGESSEGMICAAEELELGDLFPPAVDAGGRPVIDLGDGEPIAGTLAEYLEIDDVVIDVDNHAITNRPDLFSHLGFARECVAIGLADWKYKPNFKLSEDVPGTLPFTIENQIPKLVPCYRGLYFTIDGFNETPDWIKTRLNATGWRPVSPMVDIANYVMMDIGQPLHAFNTDDFKGPVIIREAIEGETMVTLDNKERSLPEGAIVLSDDEGVFDLFGIMGGLRTSTKENTKNFFLQAAIIDPVRTRRTMIATGHRTDGGTVYEKGVPTVLSSLGLIRAIELIKSIAINPTFIAEYFSGAEAGKKPAVTVDLNKVSSLLGTEVGDIKATEILTSLECEVSGSGQEITVTPPPFRTDLTMPEDFIEDIGRVIGYDNIAPKLPSRIGTLPKRDTRVKKLRGFLADMSGYELLPINILGPKELSELGYDISDCQEIENPIGEEMSLMHPSLIPHLLKHAAQQMGNLEEMLTFTVGSVFSKQNGEHQQLGILISSKSNTQDKDTPIYKLISIINEGLKRIGYTLEVKPHTNATPTMHPGRASQLEVDGQIVGEAFELHPAKNTALELAPHTAVATINLKALLDAEAQEIVAQKLPDYPAVSYDETIKRTHAQSTAELLSSLHGSSDNLKSVEVVDTYQPEGSSTYNLTLRFTYRSNQKTLTEAEVKPEHEKVTQGL